jgi:hypothetical protein
LELEVLGGHERRIGLLRPREVRARKVCAIETSAVQDRIAQIGAGEIGAREIAMRKIGVSEARRSENGSGEAGVIAKRPFDPRFVKASSFGERTGKDRFMKVRARKIRAA